MTFNKRKNNQADSDSCVSGQPRSYRYTGEFICPVWKECLKRQDSDCAKHGCLNAVMYKNKQRRTRHDRYKGDMP